MRCDRCHKPLTFSHLETTVYVDADGDRGRVRTGPFHADCAKSLPRRAPWPDADGHSIYEGDWIAHPNGDRGRVLYSLDPRHEGVSRWRAVYEDHESLWLGNQIGDKGRAVVAK